MQLIQVDHTIEAVDTALRRLGGEIEIVVIGLRSEHPSHRSDEAVEQDCALRIGRLLDESVVVQREDIDPLEREGARQQSLN
jgi:hypothetical protein